MVRVGAGGEARRVALDEVLRVGSACSGDTKACEQEGTGVSLQSAGVGSVETVRAWEQDTGAVWGSVGIERGEHLAGECRPVSALPAGAG